MFKVGDKVRVLRASKNSEHDLWGDIWLGCKMDMYIGKVYVVNKIRNYGYKYHKYYLGNYWFPEFVLQKSIIVGQQLLLWDDL